MYIYSKIQIFFFFLNKNNLIQIKTYDKIKQRQNKMCKKTKNIKLFLEFTKSALYFYSQRTYIFYLLLKDSNNCIKYNLW